MFKNLCLLTLSLAQLGPSAVLRVEVSKRSDVLGGKSFGSAGPYERMVGKVFFAVDPNLPANKIITDIDKAPRNAKGLVEFSSDLYVIKPRDPSRGNGNVFYEVSNRGRKGTLTMFNHGSSSFDPRSEADFGDNFLMEHGYTIVWLGWQFDVARDEGLMRLYAPVAHDGDRPITGLVRAEIIPDKKEYTHSLADRTHIPYQPMNPDDPNLVLTIRERNDAPRRPLPRGAWKIVEGTHISMAEGFEPGKIYELVYTSKDPSLVGLGPAATRDFMSFLKFGAGDTATPLSDQKQYIKRAYGYGASQSGRFLRTFLYYGFNADEKGRPVFDGVMAHIAGAGRGSFDIRFGQPSRDGHPFMNLFYPTDIFPFTDKPETDPETGMTGGILDKAEQAHVTPKIFYTDSAYEYWGRSAALIHSTIDGKQDLTLPVTTRIYFFAGGQHGPAAYPPVRTTTKNLPNPNPYTWSMRALLLAMDRWVTSNVEPPASQYPKISNGTLVTLSALEFPKIPGQIVPGRPQHAYRVDYGPEFRTRGIITIEPPKVGHAFATMLPQVNADGNETSGVRMPDIQAPLGTFTGWNLPRRRARLA